MTLDRFPHNEDKRVPQSVFRHAWEEAKQKKWKLIRFDLDVPGRRDSFHERFVAPFPGHYPVIWCSPALAVGGPVLNDFTLFLGQVLHG